MTGLLVLLVGVLFGGLQSEVLAQDGGKVSYPRALERLETLVASLNESLHETKEDLQEVRLSLNQTKKVLGEVQGESEVLRMKNSRRWHRYTHTAWGLPTSTRGATPSITQQLHMANLCNSLCVCEAEVTTHTIMGCHTSHSMTLANNRNNLHIHPFQRKGIHMDTRTDVPGGQWTVCLVLETAFCKTRGPSNVS